MMFPVVRELAVAGIPVAVACRVLEVSTSGKDELRHRPPAPRAVADVQLTETITAVHTPATAPTGRGGPTLSCGSAATSTLGKRVERLMRGACLQGVHRRRRHGRTRRDDTAAPSQDLVGRRFQATAPDRLYVADITQHRTDSGWFYLAVVLDVFSRRVVGWAMADHLRAELVVDALQMALWQRRPAPGAVHHSDHGSQYTSWAFGQRLRDAGLLGSMGSIGDCYDNGMAESFFATLQTELLDRRHWTSRDDLAAAVFSYLEGFYNPHRRHSALGYLSPASYEAAWHQQQHATAA